MSALGKHLKPRWRSRRAANRGFSMIELLVGISIIAVLAALVTSGVQGATRKTKSVQCLTKMRNLGQAIQIYTQENGEFPRSLHSAAGARKQPWAKAILPYMGYEASPTDEDWIGIFEKVYRCPLDQSKNVNIYSYALNVFFEVNPDGDDYEGMPATWRKPVNVPYGSKTILLAESKPVYYADHIMCHLWTSSQGAANAIDSTRHTGKSNYLFVDGHVEPLPLSATYDSGQRINLWNPGLAAK